MLLLLLQLRLAFRPFLCCLMLPLRALLRLLLPCLRGLLALDCGLLSFGSGLLTFNSGLLTFNSGLLLAQCLLALCLNVGLLLFARIRLRPDSGAAALGRGAIGRRGQLRLRC